MTRVVAATSLADTNGAARVSRRRINNCVISRRQSGDHLQLVPILQAPGFVGLGLPVQNAQGPHGDIQAGQHIRKRGLSRKLQFSLSARPPWAASPGTIQTARRSPAPLLLLDQRQTARSASTGGLSCDRPRPPTAPGRPSPVPPRPGAGSKGSGCASLPWAARPPHAPSKPGPAQSRPTWR